MGRCVVIGGAGIRDYEKIRSYLQEDDFYLFCDSGLRHQRALGVRPHLIVGDFDSYPRAEAEAEAEAELIALPREKDDTDTVFAVKEAVKRGFRDFLLLGAAGERLDHTLCNVSLLLLLDSLGCKGILVDDYSEMEIVSQRTALVSDAFAYFSTLSLSEKARGVRIENAKFPLQDAEITCEYQYGISNEVLPGKTARVSVREGRLLLVKVYV